MTVLITKKHRPTLIAQPEDYLIARYAALAIGLALIDASIPMPLPGIKPGFANIITLFVLYKQGFHAAASVTILRIIAASLLFGSFLSPGFAMSFTGAMVSLMTLYWVYRIPGIGPIGVSILAAFAHMMGQLILARYWLIAHQGVWLLLPIFLSAALLFGFINGLIVAQILKEDS
jgi:heptaprenyl diphosphate synthase